MMTEAEIEQALMMWRAGAKALDLMDEGEPGEFASDWSRGLADGYVGALELVLNG